MTVAHEAERQPEALHRYRRLNPGDPAPWFQQRNTSNPAFSFDSVAGRYIVLCFFGSAGNEAGRAAVDFALQHRALFDDVRISLFGVSFDQRDEAERRVSEWLPGIRHFWDTDGRVGKLYGALPLDDAAQGLAVRQLWVVLDPGLNVKAVLPMRPDGGDRAELLALLARLPPVSAYAGIDMHAPIILLPGVLGQDLCRELMGAYDRHGGEISGFMRDIDGRTVGVHDAVHKRRNDYTINEPSLKNQLQRAVQARVAPGIRKAFCFEATRMEGYIVGCYDSERGGHFRAHRDNTTQGTAHRRFALSVNLNDDFDGGELCFPEYGPCSYKMPAGGSVIFSSSLLHSVSPVSRGRRYAFLPFLYDEAAALSRLRNNGGVASASASSHPTAP